RGNSEPWCQTSGCQQLRTPRSQPDADDGSVVRVQRCVELNGGLVGLAFDRAGLRVAAQQQVRLTGQLAGLDQLDQRALVVQQRNLGAGGDIETGLDDVAVTQWNADAGIGADQAA